MAEVDPRAVAWLAGARSVVVFSGAGVSAESGVATFRGEDGLWEGHSIEEVATPSAFAADPIKVWRFYNMRRAQLQEVSPNPAHLALARLERAYAKEERDSLVVTQNVDALHTRAGSVQVVEVHGDLQSIRCVRCGTLVVDDRVPIGPGFAAGCTPTFDDLPTCEACGGLMRPNVVWFGEPLDMTRLRRAEEAAQACDLLLVVGTSAKVYPAAGVIDIAAYHRAKVVVINPEATAADPRADICLRGKAGEIVPQMVEQALAS